MMDQMDFQKSLTDVLSYLSQKNSPQPETKNEGGAVKMIDFKTAIRSWESDLRGDDKSPHTITGYINRVTLFESWINESQPNLTVDSISTEFIVRYKNHLISGFKKAGTINTKLMAIRVFFNWAVENQFCSLNPCSKVKNLVTEQQRPKSLNEEVLNKLIAEITKQGNKTNNPTHATLLSFMIKSGLRVSEICNLRFMDIDLKNQKLTVRNGKGGKFRDIPMIESLIAQYEVYIEYAQRKGRRLLKSDFIFLSRYSKQFAPIGIAKMLERYAQKAEIPHVTPHMLRHTFATVLFKKNAKINSVQKFMGHSSLNTTARYIIPSFEDLKSDISRLDG